MALIFWILFLLVVYTYIGYGFVLYLLVKLKESFFKPVKLLLPEQFPEVTLMIAAYNEEEIVSEKMINCNALDYPSDKLKIVWVTDGTTDSTNERLAVYSNVEVLFQPKRQGKTAALNRAIAFVRTPLVLFTDANTMLNKEAIKEMVLQFTDPKVGCVAGEKRIFVEKSADSASAGEGFYWKYESKLKSLDSRLYSCVGAAGELFGVRTGLFEKMETDTLLDDFILSLRIARKGYKIAYCDNAYAEEKGSADMHEEEKRKIRIAGGGLQSVWRLRGLLNPFRYGILSFQYISHRVLRWTITPFALFLLLPINIFLAYNEEGIGLYSVILVLQILFYIAAIRGYQLSQQRIKNKYLYVPYYFLFMNINVFKGIRYLWKRKGNAAWDKAKRST